MDLVLIDGRSMRWHGIAGHNPRLVEMRVLDRFSGRVAIRIFGKVSPGEVIAVAGMERPVLCLDDTGVMVAAGFRPGSVFLGVGDQKSPSRPPGTKIAFLGRPP